MGAGCCNGEGPPVERCERIGREVEGTSSKRPELGALALALRATEATHDLLYLCDNESVLKRDNTRMGWRGHKGVPGESTRR